MRLRAHEPVQTVTSAGRSLSEDVSFRTRRYLLMMGVRTVCFVLAIAAFDGWLRWVLILAAILLPYFSVVMANAGRQPNPVAAQPYVPDNRPALPPGATGAAAGGRAPGDDAPR